MHSDQAKNYVASTRGISSPSLLFPAVPAAQLRVRRPPQLTHDTRDMRRVLARYSAAALALVAVYSHTARAQNAPKPSGIKHVISTTGGATLGAFAGLTTGMIYDTIECRRLDRDPLFGCLIDLHHGAKVGAVLGSVAGGALMGVVLNRGSRRCSAPQVRLRAWLGAALGAAPAVVWLSRSPHWTSEEYNRLAMLTPLIQAGTTSLLLTPCR